MNQSLVDSVPIRFVSTDGTHNISGYIGIAKIYDVERAEKSNDVTCLFGLERLYGDWIWSILDGSGGAYDLGVFLIACSRGDGKLYVNEEELDIPVGSLLFDSYSSITTQ